MINRLNDWRDESPRETEHADHSIFDPPRALANKAARPGTPQDVDKMLAAADAKLAELRTEFPQWIAAEFELVEQAWAAYKADQPDAEKLFFRRMHDMRGQAATFGYPLAGRAADYLCKLMDAIQRVPDDIIEAHVQTIRAIIRQNINVDDHPMGVKLLEGLDTMGLNLIRKSLKDEPQAG
jgi:hypothetical protein